MIKSISLRNFKSFRELDLHLGAFNVFVGANAAGKSNILQAVKFIRDISIHGLENAVAMHSGFKFLRNVTSGTDAEVVVEADVQSKDHFFLPLTGNKRSASQAFSLCRARRFTHRLVLISDGNSFEVKEDRVRCEFSVDEPHSRGERVEKGVITLTREGERVLASIDFHNKTIKTEPNFSKYMGKMEIGKRASIAFSADPLSRISIPKGHIGSSDLAIAYYDFDPRLSKQAVRISGSSDLEESADNLAVVIQKILSNQKQKDRLIERVRDLLPHVNGLELEHFSDSSLLMNMREQYQSSFNFPASLISNGTVSVIATLIAVLFENSRIVIMEEPERNIHPYLIERLLNTIKEASTEKQILISTHSPTVLDHCDLKDLFLVKRNDDGISCVSQPKDSEMVNAFLSDGFGVGQLYQTKLLEL